MEIINAQFTHGQMFDRLTLTDSEYTIVINRDKGENDVEIWLKIASMERTKLPMSIPIKELIKGLKITARDFEEER